MRFISMLCATLVFVASANSQLVQLTDEHLKRVEPLINKCMAITNAPEEAFKKMFEGIIDDEDSLKFMYCYLLDTGYITKDGYIHIDNVTGLVKEDKLKGQMKKFLQDCNTKAKRNAHLKALEEVTLCYKDCPIHFKADVDVVNSEL